MEKFLASLHKLSYGGIIMKKILLIRQILTVYEALGGK